jgi:hypothetical protein
MEQLSLLFNRSLTGFKSGGSPAYAGLTPDLSGLWMGVSIEYL